MPSLTVHHIAHCPEVLSAMAAFKAVVTQPLTPQPGTGYLTARIGQRVQVVHVNDVIILYIETCWLYARLSDSPRAFACLRGALWGDEQTLIGHRGIPLYAAALLCKIAEAAMSTNRCDKDAYANCFCKQVIRARLEQSPEGETSEERGCPH